VTRISSSPTPLIILGRAHYVFARKPLAQIGDSEPILSPNFVLLLRAAELEFDFNDILEPLLEPGFLIAGRKTVEGELGEPRSRFRVELWRRKSALHVSWQDRRDKVQRTD